MAMLWPFDSEVSYYAPAQASPFEDLLDNCAFS